MMLQLRAKPIDINIVQVYAPTSQIGPTGSRTWDLLKQCPQSTPLGHLGRQML